MTHRAQHTHTQTDASTPYSTRENGNQNENDIMEKVKTRLTAPLHQHESSSVAGGHFLFAFFRPRYFVCSGFIQSMVVVTLEKKVLITSMILMRKSNSINADKFKRIHIMVIANSNNCVWKEMIKWKWYGTHSHSNEIDRKNKFYSSCKIQCAFTLSMSLSLFSSLLWWFYDIFSFLHSFSMYFSYPFKEKM